MFVGIITLLVFMTMILNLLGIILESAFAVFPMLIMAFIVFSIVRAIKGNSDRQKVKNAKNNTTADEAKLLTRMRNHFRYDARIYFDNETYIEPLDPQNINFSTLGLYMRDEYVGTLEEYRKAFPNAYNSFINMIDDYLKKKKYTTQKKATTTTTATPARKTEKPKETDKDATFYINTITKLNEEISEEHITEGLIETVKYLEQIRNIENNFAGSKDKTTKLYHYYLPMLVDILENYKRLSINANAHKEFKENEDRLLKTIVLINGALKTLTSSLVDEYYTEMSVDMRTLESLLKKDGLATDEMTFENTVERKEKVKSNG